jgi:hypothetical protein
MGWQSAKVELCGTSRHRMRAQEFSQPAPGVLVSVPGPLKVVAADAVEEGPWGEQPCAGRREPCALASAHYCPLATCENHAMHFPCDIPFYSPPHHRHGLMKRNVQCVHSIAFNMPEESN